MENEILIEDEDVQVLIPRRAAAKGHIIITPLQEYMILEQVPDVLVIKMFQIANKLSSVLFDTMKCHGTNILIQNGVPAGQINKNFSINIIPRYENDNIKLEWEPKKAEESALNSVVERFKSVDAEEQEKKIIEEKKEKAEKKVEEQIIEEDEDNYLIKSLEKIP